jgi:hypothetical protein
LENLRHQKVILLCVVLCFSDRVEVTITLSGPLEFFFSLCTLSSV